MRRTDLIVAVLLIIVACVAYGLPRLYTTPSLSDITACYELHDTAPVFACVRSHVERLLETHTATELLRYVTSADTMAAMSNVPRYQCHPIGHIIGELVYRKYGTIEESLNQCSSSCRSACTHGVMGAGVLAELGQVYSDDDIAHADKERLQEIGAPYCKINGAVCHGVGHLAFITTEDELEAVGVCDNIASGWNRESCYQGVFMERAGNYVNTLFPGVRERPPRRSADDYTHPCTSVPQEYRHACFLFLADFQEPLLREDGIVAPESKLIKAGEVCDTLTGTDRANCYEGIGASGYSFGFNSLRTSDIQPLCDRFANEVDRSACTLGVVPQFLYLDSRGQYSYCESVGDEARRGLCYNAAFQWIEHKYGFTDDIARMCGAYEPCRARYDSFMRDRASIPDYRFGLPVS